MKKQLTVLGLIVFLLTATGLLGCQQRSNNTSGQSGAAGGTSPARSSRVSWSSTRRIDVPDPLYQMTAYSFDAPAGWKAAGVLTRTRGCGATGASAKFTEVSPDGQTAFVMLPGVSWNWTDDPVAQRKAAAQNCPVIALESAADFLVKMAVPNLRPNAKIVAILPPDSAIQAAMQQRRELGIQLARQRGLPPPRGVLDGARVRLQYQRNGQPVEEIMEAMISCTQVRFAYESRNCSSSSELVMRAPQGHLDELLALPQLMSLIAAIKPNPDWNQRLATDQQANFQRSMAASDAKFQQGQRDSDDFFNQMRANGAAQRQMVEDSTRRALATDRETQGAIDGAAHKEALGAIDQKEFTDPNTGKTIVGSNQYNHQYVNPDGTVMVQQNQPMSHAQAVSEGWNELEPQ
jgi:hypothetical protein